MKTIRPVRLFAWLFACCLLAAWPEAHAATAPGIVTSPASQVVLLGSNAIFSVVATGTEPLKYQWKKGAANIAGATNASFTIANAQTNNAGHYTVIVSNGVRPPATSAPPAVLTVTPVPMAVDIIQQPTNLVVAVGGTTVFRVVATGYPPPTYQWVFGTGTNAVMLPGATNATLLIRNATTNKAGMYCVVVRNSLGSLVSEQGELKVISPPAITRQPASQVAVSPIPPNTNDLTEAALAGKTLLLRILGGAAPFATNGGFEIILAASGNSYSIPASGAIPPSAGHWSISEDVFGTVLRLNDSLPGGGPVNIVLLPGGRYEMYTDGPGSSQHGAWLVAGPRSGPTVNFTVETGGGHPVAFQWLFNGQPIGARSSLSGSDSATLTISNANPANAGKYSVIVSNLAGRITSAPATLVVNGSGLTDLTNPVVTITRPAAVVFRVFTNVLEISGTARDARGIAGVFVQVGGGEFRQVPGTTNWFAALNLAPGTNIVRVKTTDFAGRVSTVVSRTFFYVVPAPLALTVIGGGMVLPANLTNHDLEIGLNYKLTAVAKPGNLFSNWFADGVIYTNPMLTVSMKEGLAVTANFVTNPFLALKGNYHGLFSGFGGQTNYSSSGGFTFTVMESGAFSGQARWGLLTLPFSGKFGVEATAQTTARSGTNALTLFLRLAPRDGADQVSGVVSNRNFTSELFGVVAAFGATKPATNFAGKYTALLFAVENPDLDTNSFGDGFAAIEVSRAGQAVCKGALPDGTALNQSVPLGPEGQVLLFVPLYGGQGFLFGSINVPPAMNGDLTASFQWTKRGGAAGAHYPAGFTNEVRALGSIYTKPGAGTNALNLARAVVTLEVGNLSAPLMDRITISPNGVITVAPPNTNQLALTLQPATGLFTGGFFNPDSRKTNVIKGVVLQNLSFGGGLFLDSNQTGTVSITTEEE